MGRITGGHVSDTTLTFAIEPLTAAARHQRAGLSELLTDAVAAGASVGFIHPLPVEEAHHYWDEVLAEVEAGQRLLLIARDGDRIVGSVQLALPRKPNASHRAEVQKLLVHTSARRQGLGLALMQAVADAAETRGRHLLVLDTRAGDPACRLYEQLGYIRAGVIPGYSRSSSGRLDGSAFYHRDLRDCDEHMLGDTDVFTREFP